MAIGIRYKKIQIGDEPFIVFKDGLVAAKEVLAIKQSYDLTAPVMNQVTGRYEPEDGKVYVTFKSHGAEIEDTNRNRYFSCDPTHPLMGE